MSRSVGKDIILDFKQSTVRMAPSEWNSQRVCSKPRHYRDDRYGCLFQQSGSVETQGQSFGAGGEPFGVANTGFLLRTGDNIPAGIFLYILDKTHFRATCEALGLLGDNNEWDIAMQEACASATSSCCFEALDRTLRDILTMPYRLFRGTSVLLSGDFRQTLPVKKGASKMEIIASYEHNLITSFASWLLDIEDGKKDQNSLKTPSAITVQHKAIVCPKNKTGDMMNSKVLEMVQGETTTYLSHDDATPIERDRAETEMLYPIENLNTHTFFSFPPHRLELKVGAPVMLLRNVNVAGGLCNDTRMIVRQTITKLIEVQIITGTRIGEKVFIYRISLNHKDSKFPFVFKFRQFPIKLCYAKHAITG
nr:DNA helicase [Tanacetum cinerariifolium]